MGAKCCQVELPTANPDAIGAIAPGELAGIKTGKEYKETYKEQGSGSQFCVQRRDTALQYSCRRVPKAKAPCTDAAMLEDHFIKLNGLEHPHLCKFVEAFADADNYYLIYEMADTATLFDHIKGRTSFNEGNGADFTRQVAMALALAHSQGIVHGRLSPNSLILAFEDEDDDEDFQTQVKICDIGQGFMVRPSRISEGKKENLAYIAPELAWDEVKVNQGTLPKGADKLDMWALGAIVYHMLTGAAPFEASDEKELLNKIKSEAVVYRDEEWSKVPAQARDAVEGLLKLNSGLRLSAAQLVKHPWIKIARETMPKKRMITLLNQMEINLNEGYFKKMILRVIAEQLPKDGAQIETIEKAFRVLDRNGDGVLSVQELCDGFGKYEELSNFDLQGLFQQLDRDGSGTINVQEFVTATVNQKRSNNLPNLWQAFNAFDKDRSGAIAIDEIENIVRELEGGLLGKEQMDNLCKEIRAELQSVEKGSQIDFDQFVFIMTAPKQADYSKVMNKDMNRLAWNLCKVDLYKVRHMPVKNWDLGKTGASPRSPRSVYRRAQRGAEPGAKGRADRKSRMAK